MPGMIGMALGDQYRFSEFIPTILGLERPNDTVFMPAYGHSVAINWNTIAKQFLEIPHMEWLLLLEDDHIPPPDVIAKLLSRNVDIVSALYLQRRIPFPPIMFDKVDEDGKIHHRMLKKGEEGLVEVEACGGGCLMIRRRVLERMTFPYWYYGDCYMKDSTNHDVNFSRKARAAGFKIYVDLDVPIFHLCVVPVVPFRDAEGNWHTRLIHGEEQIITVGACEHE